MANAPPGKVLPAQSGSRRRTTYLILSRIIFFVCGDRRAVNRRGRMMLFLLALAIFDRTGRRVQSGIGSRARNLVQGIGDGTNQIFHTVTGNSRNGVEFKIALLAKIAKSFEPR